MTEFVLYIAISLDGYIARTDGRIDWLPPPNVDGEDYGYAEFYASIDGVVMGSKTYEQVLEFGEWEFADKRSYVLTHRNLTSNRDDIVLVQEGISAVLEKIKQQHLQRVWILGGGQVASAFIEQGFVDEYKIAVIPIVLGSGIPLFCPTASEHKLTLVEAKPYDDGVVMLHYRKKD